MAQAKRDVTVLNSEAPAFARLGLGGAVGLGDLLDALITQVNRLANNVQGVPLVATATTASKVKTTNAVIVLVNGVAKNLPATDNFWTLTGGNLADGSTRKYLLLVDGSNTASVLASNDVATGVASTAAFPAIPKGKTAVGSLSVATAGAVFTPGTTLISAGTVTAVYADGTPAGALAGGTIPVLV